MLALAIVATIMLALQCMGRIDAENNPSTIFGILIVHIYLITTIWILYAY